MPLELIFAAIWEKKWIILVVALATGGAVFYLMSLQEKEYVAAALMSTGITQQKAHSLDGKDEMLRPFIIQNKFDNLIRKMRSQPVFELLGLDLVIHENDMGHSPFLPQPEGITHPPNREALQVVFNQMMEGNRDRLPDSLRPLLKAYGFDKAQLDKMSSVQRHSSSDYVEVIAQTIDPEMSAYVANRYVEIFSAYYKEETREQGTHSLEMLEKLVAQKKKELDAKVNELKQYKLDNDVINLYEETKTIVNQIKDQELKREEIQQKVPALEKELQEINQYFNQSELARITQKTSSLHQKILHENKEADQGLTTQDEFHLRQNGLSKDHSDSLTKEEVLEQVKASANAFLLNPTKLKERVLLRKIEHELDLKMYAEQLASIDKELNRLYGIRRSFAPMEASIGALEREVSVASEVYLLLLNKLNNASYSLMQKGRELKMEERATVPQKHLSSKRAITTVLATVIMGFLLMVLFAFRAYLNKRMLRKLDIMWRYQMPVLAQIKQKKKNQISEEQIRLRW